MTGIHASVELAEMQTMTAYCLRKKRTGLQD